MCSFTFSQITARKNFFSVIFILSFFFARPLPLWHAMAKEAYKDHLLATKVTLCIFI